VSSELYVGDFAVIEFNGVEKVVFAVSGDAGRVVKFDINNMVFSAV